MYKLIIFFTLNNSLSSLTSLFFFSVHWTNKEPIIALKIPAEFQSGPSFFFSFALFLRSRAPNSNYFWPKYEIIKYYDNMIMWHIFYTCLIFAFIY